MSFFEKSKTYEPEKTIFSNRRENLYKLSISNNFPHSGFTDFNNSQDKKIKKNKSQSKFYKIYYPSTIKSNDNVDSTYMPSYNIKSSDPKDKDGLFLELVRDQKNMKALNKELKNIINGMKYLNKVNMSNYFILCKIMELRDNNNDEYKLKFNNNKSNEKIYFLLEENKKINVLKKQIKLYDKTIQNNEMKIEELKNKEKQKRYQELINNIENKEIEINDLSQNIEELNYKLLENETKIKFFYLKSQQYNNDIIKIKNKINYDNHLFDENQEEINIFKTKKEKYKNNKKKLEEKIKIKEKELKNLDSEEYKLDKQIEDNNDLNKEKEKNEIILEKVRNTYLKLKNDNKKIVKKLLLLNKEKKNYINQIEEYQKLRPVLIEKTKIPGRHQEIMKNMEKEIERINEEIKKRNEDDETKEKNMNNEIININNINNNYIEEINNYENEKNSLVDELNELKSELENVESKNNELTQNCSELEEKYNKIKEEYQQKKEAEEKEIKDRELKEKNFKEEKGKYEQEISEEKSRNNKLKEEKEELQKKYEEKINEVKQVNEAKDKLKTISEEMQDLSD